MLCAELPSLKVSRQGWVQRDVAPPPEEYAVVWHVPRYGRVVAGWIEAEGRKAGAFLREALSLGAVVQVV